QVVGSLPSIPDPPTLCCHAHNAKKIFSITSSATLINADTFPPTHRSLVILVLSRAPRSQSISLLWNEEACLSAGTKRDHSLSQYASTTYLQMHCVRCRCLDASLPERRLK